MTVRSAKKVRERGRIHPSKGSRLLANHIRKNYRTFEEAASALSKSGFPCLRSSLWHWSSGTHVPAARSRIALHEWAAIPIPSWDEKK